MDVPLHTLLSGWVVHYTNQDVTPFSYMLVLYSNLDKSTEDLTPLLPSVPEYGIYGKDRDI
jgi:hypothetical protein